MKLEKPSWKSRKDWSEVIFEKIQGEIIFDGNSGYQKQMILVEAKEKASEHKQKITFFFASDLLVVKHRKSLILVLQEKVIMA